MANVAVVLIFPIRTILPTGGIDRLEVVKWGERVSLLEVLESFGFLDSQALILAWTILLGVEGSKGERGFGGRGDDLPGDTSHYP